MDQIIVYIIIRKLKENNQYIHIDANFISFIKSINLIEILLNPNFTINSINIIEDNTNKMIEEYKLFYNIKNDIRDNIVSVMKKINLKDILLDKFLDQVLIKKNILYLPELLVYIFNEVNDILRNEENFIYVDTKFYVANVLNLKYKGILDLIKKSNESIIFTGNYINKTNSCFDTFILLMLMKLKFPKKIILLRGFYDDITYGAEIQNLNEKSILLQLIRRYKSELTFYEYTSFTNSLSFKIPSHYLNIINNFKDIYLFKHIIDIINMLPLSAYTKTTFITAGALPQIISYFKTKKEFVDYYKKVKRPIENINLFPTINDLIRGHINLSIKTDETHISSNDSLKTNYFNTMTKKGLEQLSNIEFSLLITNNNITSSTHMSSNQNIKLLD